MCLHNHSTWQSKWEYGSIIIKFNSVNNTEVFNWKVLNSLRPKMPT